MRGPGIKQHIRLMHPEVHAQHATAAASRSSHLGLRVTNPCHYCLQDVQDIRTHLKKCPVVFQASLAALVLAQDGRRGRSSICGTGGAAGSPGRRRPGIGIENGSRRTASGHGDTGPQGDSREASGVTGLGRQQKWPRTDSKGKGPSGWAGWGSKRQWEEDEAEKGEAAKLDKQTQAVIQSLVQLSLRHEAELGRIRSESAFIFFLDMPGVNPELGIILGVRMVAKEWTTQYTAGTVKSPLRTLLLMAVVRELKQRLEQFLANEERCSKAQALGWLCEGHNALDPLWTYWGWNPREKRQERTEQPSVQSTVIQAQLHALEQNLGKEGVLLNFRCTKDLEEETEAEVLPFMATVGFRSSEANATYAALQMLSRNAVCKLIGTRVRPERLARQPVAKQLEENHLATSYCPWARRSRR